MPYIIRKLPNREMYRVSNKESGAVKCKECTLSHAKKQVRLLNYLKIVVFLDKNAFNAFFCNYIFLN